MKEEICDNFEEKGLSDIWSDKLLAPKALEIQSNIVRNGKRAVKITLHQGDIFEKNHSKDKATERGELTERVGLWSREEGSYSYSFSIFIPEDFPIVPTRLVLAQWKQCDELNKATVNNPVIALRYVNGELFITLQTSEEKIKLFRTEEIIKNKWADFTFNIRFSRTESGFLKVFMNKKEIIDYNGITAYSKKYNYPENGLFYFKMGLYRDTMKESMTAYFDEYRKMNLS